MSLEDFFTTVTKLFFLNFFLCCVDLEFCLNIIFLLVYGGAKKSYGIELILNFTKKQKSNLLLMKNKIARLNLKEQQHTFFLLIIVQDVYF